MNPEVKHDVTVQGAASLPSWAVIVTWLLGISVEKWAAAAGLFFILLQCGFLIWKWRRSIRHEAERLRRGLPPPPPTTDNATL